MADFDKQKSILTILTLTIVTNGESAHVRQLKQASLHSLNRRLDYFDQGEPAHARQLMVCLTRILEGSSGRSTERTVKIELKCGGR